MRLILNRFWNWVRRAIELNYFRFLVISNFSHIHLFHSFNQRTEFLIDRVLLWFTSLHRGSTKNSLRIWGYPYSTHTLKATHQMAHISTAIFTKLQEWTIEWAHSHATQFSLLVFSVVRFDSQSRRSVLHFYCKCSLPGRVIELYLTTLDQPILKLHFTSSISSFILVTSTRDRLEDIDSPFRLDGLSRFTFEVCRIPSAPHSPEFIEALEKESDIIMLWRPIGDSWRESRRLCLNRWGYSLLKLKLWEFRIINKI